MRMSLKNIKSNKMRSFLTMLGIIIGVAAVISMMTIVQGVMDAQMKQYESLGAGTLIISAPGTSLKKGLTSAELETLASVDGVDGISPEVSVTTTASYEGTVYKKISVTGYGTDYFRHNKDLVKLGRAFYENETDGDVNVCIVDKNFVSTILKGHQALGSMIQLGGYTYTIVGIQKEDDSIMGSSSDNSSLDGSVIIPYRNAMKLGNSYNIAAAVVYIKDGYTNSQVATDLRNVLSKIYNGKENSYSVINYESLVKMMNQMKTMLTSMLGGIAGIALLVGGIGIMNMMLVSVTERTKEIGLRKALGAEPIRIQLEFLLEAVTLSLMGGFVGVGVGIGISYVGSILMKFDFKIMSDAIVLGVGFSIAVGVIFGWAPASRGSKLNPIDALRSE